MRKHSSATASQKLKRNPAAFVTAKKFESFCVCLGERAAPDMQQQQRPGSARNSIIASQAGGTAGRASLITNARFSVVNRADSRHGPPKRSALGSVIAVNALTSAAAA